MVELTREHIYTETDYKTGIKTKMLISAGVAAIIGALCYRFREAEWCFILAIVAATTCYHLVVRLAVIWLVKLFSDKYYSFDNFWLRQKKWEGKLYKLLKVRFWKNKFPAYFELRNGLKNVFQATCVAEIAHTVIIPLSFLPLVFAIIWGDVADIIVFAITGALAGTVDLMMLIVQRYNRPRLIKFYERNGEIKLKGMV